MVPLPSFVIGVSFSLNYIMKISHIQMRHVVTLTTLLRRFELPSSLISKLQKNDWYEYETLDMYKDVLFRYLKDLAKSFDIATYITF